MKLLRKAWNTWGALLVLAAMSGTVTAAITFRSAIPFGTAFSWSSATGGDPNATQGPWYNANGHMFAHTSDNLDSQLDVFRYSVMSYGCKGDGVADDTTCVQNAITAAVAVGGTVLFPPGTTYKLTSSITISGATTLQMYGATLNSSAANCIIISGSNIKFYGGTLNMLSTGATQYGINPSGTVGNFYMQDMTLNGTATIADAQTGFGNNSGPALSGIRILHNIVTNMSVGISLNANLGGSITDALIEGNRVSNTVGTLSGSGYGIHHANGSGNPSLVRIIGNYLETSQRHDIYQANGIGVSIIGNHTFNHRQGVCGGVDRPSISVGRSSDVIVADNVVENSCDAAFDIFTDTAGSTSNNVRITNNVVRNWTNFPAIQVGDPAPATNGFPTDVVISGNHFYNDLTVTGSSGTAAASAIYMYSGKRVTVSDNSFYMVNATSASNIVDILGQSETAGTTLYNENQRFIGNQMFGTGTNNRLFRLESAACGSATTMHFWNNLADVGTVFVLAASQTNPNIYVWQTPQGGLTAANVHALDANLYKGFQMSSQASNPCPASTSCIYNNTGNSNVLLSNVADGATAVAAIVDTTNTLSNGASKIMSWRNNTAEKMSLSLNGVLSTVGLAGNYRSASSTVTVAITDFYVGVSGSGARTVNLPAANTCKAGQTFVIQEAGGSAGAVTINRNGADTINGGTSIALVGAYEQAVFVCDGTSAWFTDPIGASSGAAAGTWAPEELGTSAVSTNFIRPYQTVANTPKMRNVACSWTVAGTLGTTGVVAQVVDTSNANAELCNCTLGACTTTALTPLVCDCNSAAIVAGHAYAFRLKSTSDCSTFPQNVACSVELTQ